jgi:peroxin-2
MSLMNLRYRNEAAVQLQPVALSDSGSSSSSSSGVQPPCIGGGHSGVEGPGLSPTQRSLYCLGAVVLRYAWGRLGQYAAGQHWGDSANSTSGGGSFSWRQRGWQLMRQAESGYRLASLLNFLAFLCTGRYRWEPTCSSLCALLECCVCVLM